MLKPKRDKYYSIDGQNKVNKIQSLNIKYYCHGIEFEKHYLRLIFYYNHKEC